MKFVGLFFILLCSIGIFAQTGGEARTVRRFIDAFNARNLDAMMSLATDDVRWLTVAGDKIKTETADKSSLRIFIEGYFKSCPSCRSKITTVAQNGIRVTMTETASWDTPTGKRSSESFVVYEFENGKIKRVYYYAEPLKSDYDADLAKKLGADDYGMKVYVFVSLKRGAKQLANQAELDKTMQGHLKNIGRLADLGKLIVAGPFADDQDVRGIFVFDVRTIDEAKELVAMDPAVKAGVLVPDYRLWYCSAALIEVGRIHKTIQKKSMTN